MERRVLLAIFLCFLVLYLWNAFVVKPAPKPAAATAPSSAAPASTSISPAQQQPTIAEAPTAPPPAATPLVGEARERDVRIETRDVVAVFNGELYNFRELRRELEAAGHEIGGTGDSPVIPHAYEEWGLEFVERLEKGTVL